LFAPEPTREERLREEAKKLADKHITRDGRVLKA
jgi:hypothetical protein